MPTALQELHGKIAGRRKQLQTFFDRKNERGEYDWSPADRTPDDPTDLQTIKYIRETTYTNSAAPTAEGAALPASALAYTQVSQTVELIGTTIQVTNQQMSDVPAMRGLIDGRMMLQLGQ